MRGDEFRAYDKAFVVGGVGVRVDPDGVIMARLGASLSAIFDECKALFETPGYEGVEFPWIEHVDTVGSRKAPYYVEHRDGISFSYRGRIAAKMRAGKGKAPATRVPARYVRRLRYLAEGWRIERVA